MGVGSGQRFAPGRCTPRSPAPLWEVASALPPPLPLGCAGPWICKHPSADYAKMRSVRTEGAGAGLGCGCVRLQSQGQQSQGSSSQPRAGQAVAWEGVPMTSHQALSGGLSGAGSGRVNGDRESGARGFTVTSGACAHPPHSRLPATQARGAAGRGPGHGPSPRHAHRSQAAGRGTKLSSLIRATIFFPKSQKIVNGKCYSASHHASHVPGEGSSTRCD